MTYKLDIFNILDRVSRKDSTFLSTLSEEEVKALQPFLIQRWLSGTSDARQIYFLNEVVNSYIFTLPKHKELLWQLMTICTTGKATRYTWNKLPGSTTTSKPIATRTVSEYFNYSKRDAVSALQLLSMEDVLQYAVELGTQKDDLAKIKKEMKL